MKKPPAPLPENPLTSMSRATCGRPIIFGVSKIILKTWKWPWMIAIKMSMGFSEGPPPAAKDLEDAFRLEVFALLQKEGMLTDFVIENMMNPADGGTVFPSIAARPSGRTMKRDWKIWPDTLSGRHFHPSG